MSKRRTLCQNSQGNAFASAILYLPRPSPTSQSRSLRRMSSTEYRRFVSFLASGYRKHEMPQHQSISWCDVLRRVKDLHVAVDTALGAQERADISPGKRKLGQRASGAAELTTQSFPERSGRSGSPGLACSDVKHQNVSFVRFAFSQSQERSSITTYMGPTPPWTKEQNHARQNFSQNEEAHTRRCWLTEEHPLENLGPVGERARRGHCYWTPWGGGKPWIVPLTCNPRLCPRSPS